MTEFVDVPGGRIAYDVAAGRPAEAIPLHERTSPTASRS